MVDFVSKFPFWTLLSPIFVSDKAILATYS